MKPSRRAGVSPAKTAAPPPVCDEATERRRRVLALADSEEIAALVDSWPDPDEEQLRTLALLLAPGGDRDA